MEWRLSSRCNAEAGGGVGLGIAVDQEDLEAFKSQAGGEVDGGGGFAHTALLVHDRRESSPWHFRVKGKAACVG